jgi:hypothetical protein
VFIAIVVPRANHDDEEEEGGGGGGGGDIARGASASGRGEPYGTGDDEVAGEEKEKARAGPNDDGGVGGPESSSAWRGRSASIAGAL